MNEQSNLSATAIIGKITVISEKPTLSLVIPVHNEEEILEKQTRNLIEYLQKLGEEFEIVFVENGSTDKTLYLIKRMQKNLKEIRLQVLRKADYSTAVIEGINAVRGKYCIVMGIDYVDLPVLSRCFNALKNADVVICSKNKGLDGRPFLNRLINRGYNVVVRLFFGLPYSDIEGYHGYNTEKIQKIIGDIKTKAHLCNLWILLKARKAGLKIDEIPIVVNERRKSRFMRVTRLPYLAAISLIEFTKLKGKGY